MPQTYLYLAMTDGTQTLTLANGLGTATDAFLERESWTPKVARLRGTDLGGQSRYLEVVEEIPIAVRASTTALTMARVNTFNDLIAQAERWSRGENVAAVRIEYAPIGSDIATTANPYRATITGYASDTDGAAEMAANAESTKVQRFVRGTFRFRRRGQWLLATEEQSTQVTTFRSYDKAALTFPTAPSTRDHPLRVTISGLTTTNGAWYPGYLVVAPSGDHIQIHEAETTYATGTAVASGDIPRGGSTRSFTTSSANGAFAVGATLGVARQFHLLTSVEYSSGTWTMFGRLTFASGAISDTPTVPIVANTRGPAHAPQMLILPPLATGETVSFAEIFFQGSGQLYVDWVALAGDAQIVKLGDPGGYSTSTPNFLEIDARPLFGLKPGVKIWTGGGAASKPITYEEDAYLVSGGGSTVGVMWAQNEYQASTVQFGITATGVGSAAKQHTVTVYRQLAFTVAQ